MSWRNPYHHRPLYLPQADSLEAPAVAYPPAVGQPWRGGQTYTDKEELLLNADWQDNVDRSNNI